VYFTTTEQTKISEPSPSSRRYRSETAAMGHANPGYHYGPRTGIQPSVGVS